MSRITGRDHYCVRCHDRPIDNDVWRGGGKGSRLCSSCQLRDALKAENKRKKKS